MARKGKGKKGKKKPGAASRQEGSVHRGSSMAAGDSSAAGGATSTPAARPTAAADSDLRRETPAAKPAISDSVGDAEHKVAEWIHNNVEMLAVAVIYALFIKFFVVEAFRIPSSSMEPTLIGSPYISDKILVSKNHYLFFSAPKRFDVAVFKYPNNRSRAYIKRVVGMPGDHLLVQDGDALQWLPGADGEPDRIVPFDRLLRTSPEDDPDPRVLDSMLYPLYPFEGSLMAVQAMPVMPLEDQFSDVWTREPEDGSYHLERGSQTVIGSTPRGDGGVREWIRFSGDTLNTKLLTSGKDRRKGSFRNNHEIAVEDIVLAFDLVGARDALIAGGVLTSAQSSSGSHPLEALFALDARAGTCTLTAQARAGDGKLTDLAPPQQAELPPTALASLQSGGAARVRFEHVDFHLRLWIDGQLLLELPYPVRRKALHKNAVTVRFGSAGDASFENLYLARDLFYSSPGQTPVTATLKRMGLLPLTAPEPPWVSVPGPFVNHPFLVPPGHYVLLGDNSFNSADSRHWHLCGYLERDGQPRVWENAGYAIARPDPDGTGHDARFDIFGRTFVPDPAEAMRAPAGDGEEGEPVLLGYWLVDQHLIVGFHDEASGEIVDIHGNRTKAARPIRFRNFVMEDRRVPQAKRDEEGYLPARGDSFSVLCFGPPTYDKASGLWHLGVHDPSAPNGITQVTFPDPGGGGEAQYGAIETPHIVWSPFVAREQLLGKAFSVFLPGGFGGGTATLGRFKYIR